MKTKILVFNSITLVIAVIIMSANLQQKPWVIPTKYKTMKNPVKSSPTAISAGKSLYNIHCKSCHGSTGKGDGVKAKTLKTPLTDLACSKAQAPLDGEIYYKAIIGRDEAPNFEKKIPEETDRWNLVNYIRSLRK